MTSCSRRRKATLPTASLPTDVRSTLSYALGSQAACTSFKKLAPPSPPLRKRKSIASEAIGMEPSLAQKCGARCVATSTKYVRVRVVLLAPIMKKNHRAYPYLDGPPPCPPLCSLCRHSVGAVPHCISLGRRQTGRERKTSRRIFGRRRGNGGELVSATCNGRRKGDILALASSSSSSSSPVHDDLLIIVLGTPLYYLLLLEVILHASRFCQHASNMRVLEEEMEKEQSVSLSSRVK